MKKQLAFCILLFGSLGASAQTGRWDISVTGGPSIPVMAFAQKNTTESGSQYAQTGWDAQFRVNYKVITGIDFSAVVGHQVNGFDNGAFYPVTNYSSYSSWRILVGPSFRWFPGDQKTWALTARTLYGLQWSGSNEYQGFSNAPFTFQGGVGAQYNLTRHWYLMATGDFVTATYKRLAEQTKISGPRNAFDVGAGIGVYL
jgi:hypothetical protein